MCLRTRANTAPVHRHTGTVFGLLLALCQQKIRGLNVIHLQILTTNHRYTEVLTHQKKAHECFIASYAKLRSWHAGLSGVADWDQTSAHTKKPVIKSVLKGPAHSGFYVWLSFPFPLMCQLVFPWDQCHARMLTEGFTTFSFKTRGKKFWSETDWNDTAVIQSCISARNSLHLWISRINLNIMRFWNRISFNDHPPV